MFSNKRAVNLHVIHGSFSFPSAPDKPFGKPKAVYFFLCFRRCCLKTHIQKQLHFIICNASVKSHRDPARLAHMIRREKSLFSKQRTYQYRITFEINHLQHFFSLQPQFLLWHIHYNGKPFFITAMAEHSIIRILYPRMIRLCTIIIPYIFF